MRFLKLGLISIVVLFLLATAISFMFPSKVVVSRAVTISAPADSVLALVKNLDGWQVWIEGMKDSSVKIISPLKGTLGTTEVTITEITPAFVNSEWLNKSGKKLVATFHFIPDSLHTATVVQWQFEQNLKWYPWEKFGSLMSDKILGTMMEKNLNNLKSTLEKH